MYKDDNLIPREGCNEALLRIMTEGKGNAPLQDLKSDCSCARKKESCKNGWGLEGYPLAMVYSPLQSFDGLYDIDSALKQGTLFKELDLDFRGRRIDKGGKRCD